MSTPGKKAGANLAKVALVIVLPLCVVLWAVWHYAAQSLNPQVSQDEAQVVVGVALLLWMVCMAVAEKRTRLRLANQSAGGARAGFASAVAGSLRVGSLSNYTVTTAWRLASALLSVLAVLIACGLVVVMAGYAPVAVPDRWPWTALPWAVLPIGLVTAFAVARKIAAVLFDVGLTPRMLGRQMAAWPLGVIGGAAAFFTTGMPVSTAAVLGATSGLAVSSTGTGIAAARQAKRKRAVAGNVAASFPVAQSTFDDPHKANWKVNRDGSIQIFTPLPADVLKGMDGLEAGLAARLPTHEVAQADPQTGITLTLVSPDTLAERELLGTTEGLVTAIVPGPEPEGERVELPAGYDDLTDRRQLMAGRSVPTGVAEVQKGVAVLTAGHPVHQTADITLAASVGSGAVGALRARLRDLGWSLTSLDLGAHRATVSSLAPWESALRDRIASALRVDPWSLGLTATWVDDDGPRLDEVLLTGLPTSLGSVEKGRPVLREMVLSVIPGGNEGWKVHYDSQASTATLTHAEPPTLPASVAFGGLPLDDLSWWKLPLGVDPSGGLAYINLKLGPHAAVVGPTGSGKSVAARTLLTGALLAGHDVIICDAVKRAVDFVGLRPWVTAFATDHTAVRIALERAYEEGRRRMEIIEREASRAARAGEDVPESWADLPAEVRKREGIAPLLVLLDEAAGHMMAGKVPKTLPADDPKRVAAEKRLLNAESIQQAVTLMTAELRAAGVFVVLATQRPDASILGGLLRSNLTSRVQQSKPGEPPSREALTMVFDPDELEPAREAIRVLGRDRQPGLAVMAADGGSVTGLRIAYAAGRTLPHLLDEAGVPRVTDPWDLRDPDEIGDEGYGPPPEWDATEPAEESVPEVTDLGELDLDIDVTDLESDPVTETSTATTEPESKPAFDFGKFKL